MKLKCRWLQTSLPALKNSKQLIPYAIRAIVTWAATFDELLLLFDYIYRLAGT